MILSLYFQIILSFLLHAFNFKKHLHSFFSLLTTTNSTNNNKFHLKCHNNHSFSSTTKHVIPLPLSPPIRDIDELTACTKSIGFKSTNEMKVDDDLIYENDEYEGDEYDGECCRHRRTRAAEVGVNSNTFPPPLSSLDDNGQPSFILLPMRKNGRLQLSKVRVERPGILYADRQDGRLRLYLVPDQYMLNDLEHDEEEEEEVLEEEEITIVESELSEEEMVEESRYEEDGRVREGSYNKERYRRRCHQQLVNHIHGSHNNLLMYGVA